MQIHVQPPISHPLSALGKPLYLHIGEEIDGVDMRAEVGLLSRNIMVRGEVEDRCYPYSNHVCNFFDFDTFGGHIKVWDPGRWGDGNRSQEQVQGLCGRQVPPPRVLFRQSTPGRKTGGGPVGDGHPLPAHTAPGLPLSTAPATSLPRSLLQCFARVLSQRSISLTRVALTTDA